MGTEGVVRVGVARWVWGCDVGGCGRWCKLWRV